MRRAPFFVAASGDLGELRRPGGGGQLPHALQVHRDKLKMGESSPRRIRHQAEIKLARRSLLMIIECILPGHADPRLWITTSPTYRGGGTPGIHKY